MLTKTLGSRTKFDNSTIDKTDLGINVKDILDLIEGNFYSEIYKNLDIEKIKNDFINIKGASSLCDIVRKMDKKFVKFDVISELKDVRCLGIIDTKTALIEISNIKDIDILKITGKDLIVGKSKYSVKSDYLDKLYSIDKFLNFCHDKEYKDIIKMNLDCLDEKNFNNEHEKQFRFLKDNKENYYIRAITSANKYKNYDIKISVFVCLITLYNLMKATNDEFTIRYCSCSESDIRVVFKKNGYKKILDGLNVGFELELINDEVKREAIKFNGLFSIMLDNKRVVSLKPDVKSKIISFSHTIGINKMNGILNQLPNAMENFINTMYSDTEHIKNTKSPNELKEFLYSKVKNSQLQEFREKYRSKVQKKLEEENVSTIYQLLDLMNKIDLMIDDSDILSKDYWRFKLYEVLIKGKKFE